MKRGKILAAALGIAGVGMLALGMSSAPASADPYCGPHYHWYAGYCYPNRPVIYYPPPPAYYPPPPPPVVVAPVVAAPIIAAPTLGFTFAFGGGHHGHH